MSEKFSASSFHYDYVMVVNGSSEKVESIHLKTRGCNAFASARYDLKMSTGNRNECKNQNASGPLADWMNVENAIDHMLTLNT